MIKIHAITSLLPIGATPLAVPLRQPGGAT